MSSKHVKSKKGKAKAKPTVIIAALPKKRPATAVAHGKGLYEIGGKPAGAALGGAVGKLFGGAGESIGNAIGGGAHWLINKLTGWGEYHGQHEVKNGMLNASHRGNGGSGKLVLTQTIPAIARKKSFPDANVITFRERLCDVMGTTDFVSRNFTINPGNARTFPWLSGTAGGYSQYSLLGMVLEYRSLSGDNSNSVGEGLVAMGVQYEVNSSPLPSMNALSQSPMAMTGKPDESFLAGVECDPREVVGGDVKTIRVGSNDLSGIDERMSDWGIFQIATQGQPASAVGVTIGEVWISYSVALIKPTLVRSAASGCYAGESSVPIVSATNSMFTSLTPFPGATIELKSNSANSLTMPKIAGCYQLSVYIANAAGAPLTTGLILSAASSDVAPVLNLRNYTGVNTAVSTCSSGNQGLFIYTFNYSAKLNSSTVADLTFTPATVTGGSYWVYVSLTNMPAFTTIGMGPEQTRLRALEDGMRKQQRLMDSFMSKLAPYLPADTPSSSSHEYRSVVTTESAPFGDTEDVMTSQVELSASRRLSVESAVDVDSHQPLSASTLLTDNLSPTLLSSLASALTRAANR